MHPHTRSAPAAGTGANAADRMGGDARRHNLRRAPSAANHSDDHAPGHSPPPLQYYRPQVQCQSSEPGSAVEIPGSGYRDACNRIRHP